MYIIDEDNVMQVWDECLQRITAASKTAMALLHSVSEP
jgi:hypothetical protein